MENMANKTLNSKDFRSTIFTMKQPQAFSKDKSEEK